jgi:hypothetical protein
LQEYPGIKFVELGKVLGERWRALTPLQKKHYEGIAAEDKVRFQMEMQQYTANQAAAAPPPVVADHFSYQDPAQAPGGYEAYTQHHDPYAQHTQFHAA